METTDITINDTVEGLESLESSQTVSNISDFLSFEELGMDMDKQLDHNIDLEEVEKPSPKKEETGDTLIPLEQLSGDDLGITLEEVEDQAGPAGVDYKSIVSELISTGVWDEIGSFETEDGEVSFEDMDIDKETFTALMKHNQDELKTKLTSNSVSTEGISEFTQKLISIEKHGGNVQQALNAFQTIKEPLNNLDVTDVRGQRAVCYLRLQQQGISGEEASDLIETYERKGVLEDKAVSFKDQLDTAFDEWMEKQEENAINEDRLYRETLKNYKSTLNDAFKTSKEFELSETHRKKLVDIATKEKEDGSFELDTLIDNHRKNPLDAAELVLFITDKDAYIQSKTKALLDEERKKTLKTINIIPKGKSSIDLKDRKDKNKDNDVLMSLDKLR